MKKRYTPSKTFALFVLAAVFMWLSAGQAAAPDVAYEIDAVCAGAGPEYYQIELVPTTNVPGSQRARGYVDVTYDVPNVSTISVTPDGSYAQRLELSVSEMNVKREGELVAWVASPNLDSIEAIGRLDEDLTISGRVSFNKFLVILTLEPNGEELGEKWRGPIVMRGMSRSGMMHTMIGHGPLEEEPCASYGFQ